MISIISYIFFLFLTIKLYNKFMNNSKKLFNCRQPSYIVEKNHFEDNDVVCLDDDGSFMLLYLFCSIFIDYILYPYIILLGRVSNLFGIFIPFGCMIIFYIIYNIAYNRFKNSDKQYYYTKVETFGTEYDEVLQRYTNGYTYKMKKEGNDEVFSLLSHEFTCCIITAFCSSLCILSIIIDLIP